MGAFAEFSVEGIRPYLDKIPNLVLSSIGCFVLALNKYRQKRFNFQTAETKMGASAKEAPFENGTIC